MTWLFLCPVGEDPSDVATINAGELPWIQLPVPPCTGCPPSIHHMFPLHPRSRAGVPDRVVRVWRQAWRVPLLHTFLPLLKWHKAKPLIPSDPLSTVENPGEALQPVYFRNGGTRPAPWAPRAFPTWAPSVPVMLERQSRWLCWLDSPLQAHHEQAPRSVWDLSWQESGTHWNLSQGQGSEKSEVDITP